MPNLPLVVANPVSAVPSSYSTGTALVAAQLQGSRVDGQIISALGSFMHARQAAIRAEQEQAVGARAMALQNQLKTAELEAAATTGNADDYVSQMQDRTQELFAGAYEGLTAEQSRHLAPKLEALQSTHDYNVKFREIAKRQDSGRGALAAQERDALSMIRNPDSSPYDRGVAQSNYFESLAEAVNSGLYDAVTAEAIKTKFNDTAAGLNTAAAEDAFVAHWASAIEGSGVMDPRAVSRYIDTLPGTDVQKQKLRDEMDDRISRDRKFQREQEADVAGNIAAKVVANPGAYTLQSIQNIPGLAGRFKDDVIKLYKSARDEGNPVEDVPEIRDQVLQKLRTMDPKELASYNFLPEFYLGKDLALSSKTMNFIWSAQQQARAGAASAFQERNRRAYSLGLGQAAKKGFKGQKALDFANAFALEYPTDRDLSAKEELDLGDSIGNSAIVRRNWYQPNVGGLPFEIDRGKFELALRDGDIDTWPGYWFDKTIDAVIAGYSGADAKLSHAEQLRKAIDFSKNNPEAFREEAQKALADELQRAPE